MGSRLKAYIDLMYRWGVIVQIEDSEWEDIIESKI